MQGASGQAVLVKLRVYFISTYIIIEWLPQGTINHNELSFCPSRSILPIDLYHSSIKFVYSWFYLSYSVFLIELGMVAQIIINMPI
jgi:hypothetical protein